MRYTVSGFQQDKLLEFKLDTNDALILRTIKDMYSSYGMEFILENGIKYMWINYTYLLEQIPIIGSKRTLMTRIKKYKELNILQGILRNEKDGNKGNFAYISPGMNLDVLEDLGYSKMEQPLCKNFTRVMKNLHNKDSSIKDYKDIYCSSDDELNKKNFSDKGKTETKEQLVEVFTKEIWNKYPKKQGKTSITRSLTKLRELVKNKDKVIKAINNYIAYVDQERKTNFPNLQYKNGSTFFNNWMDYYEVEEESENKAQNKKSSFLNSYYNN